MRTLAAAVVILASAASVQAAERHHAPSPDTMRRGGGQTERDRTASDAASKAAAAKAAAASAQEQALVEQRVAAAARLRQAEIATNTSAERIATLVRERDAAEAALAARSAQLVPLLPLIERVSLFPAETMLAVPQPADRALRAVLVLRGLAAGLERDASALRAEEARIAELAKAEQAETPVLTQAQSAQARLAADLDRQLAEAARTRSAADDAATAAARRAAEDAAKASTLQGVLTHVQRPDHHDTAHTQEAAVRPAAPAAGGLLTAPVTGSIVHHWGDTTPAGAATGISWQSAPLARVVAPCAGRAVFAGPFRSYGQLVILDCGGGVHAVLGGMQRLDVQPGAQLAAGEPVGEMPDWNPRAEPASGRPTLYFELRRGEQPVDPAPFLRGQG
jgi:murein hydrolase activator